jgi:uncharacterized membrane protein HdeD (DUF308 family)
MALALVRHWRLLGVRGITGALQLIAAMTLRLEMTTCWLLGFGGAGSVVLAAFLMLLPAAGTPDIAHAVGVYALLFGALVLGASLRLRRWPHHGDGKLRPVSARLAPAERAS